MDRPGAVIAEAARVLKPGGPLLLPHLQPQPLSWLVVIKGLEWFVRNTPERMHVLPLFIKPKELDGHCRRAGLGGAEWTGMRPRPGSRAFWRMLRRDGCRRDFAFRFTPSLPSPTWGWR